MSKINIEKLESTEVMTPFSFMFGGKASFSIVNMKSGTTYKYRVSCPKDSKDMFFVRVANKSDSYKYAGFIKFDETGHRFKYVKGNKGTLDRTDDPIKGIIYAISKGNKPLPRPMIMVHHGKCACCGRSLDDAESVRRGFGPVCWDRLMRSKHQSLEASGY